MGEADRYRGYEPFASVYARHWGGRYPRTILPVLERLALDRLRPGARILDLCCGPGHLAAMLVERGFAVTGIDGSDGMLQMARCNAPGASFVLADARDFHLDDPVDLALCTYDSLNHVESLEGLGAVFRHVASSLAPGGSFLFDLNMDAGYRARWKGSFAIVEDDEVVVVRASYDPETRAALHRVTWFTEDGAGGSWGRGDVTLAQYCYTEGEVREALTREGLADLTVFDGKEDLGLPGAVGRSFFLCRRPPGRTETA